MIPSHRSLTNRSRDLGEAMPYVPELAELYALGVTFRRGQLVMIAGRPGSMKSAVAMWLTSQWHEPTVYVNADMGEHVSTIREACICTGLTTDEVMDILHDPARKPAMVSAIRERSELLFVHDAMPSLQDIDAEIDAYVEMYDDYPAVIAIDNLMDLEPINDSEYASNKQLLLELKVTARTTGALILVLHHNREESDSRYPAPVRQIQGKVSQTPEVILSVALDGQVFRIAVVKNRSGASSPMADKWAELIADPARTAFRANSFHARAAQQWATAATA